MSTERLDLDREWPAIVTELDTQLRAAQAETRRRYPDAAVPAGLGTHGRAMVESPRFVEAFNGFEGSHPELVRAVGDLHGELERLAWFAREYTAQQKDGRSVLASIREAKRIRAEAVKHLRAARKLLDSAYGARIDALLADLGRGPNPTPTVQIEVMLFGVDALGKRGAAAKNRAALNGAAIRRVAEHVPAGRPNRAAVIVGLLKLAGISIRNQTVTATLRRLKSNRAA